jgi:enoyl-CoA hydratase
MKSSDFEFLKLDYHENRVTTLTINRPDKLNALNSAVLKELDRALQWLRNDEKTGVLIITGAGEKAFVAGADIKELSALTKAQGEQVSAAGQDIFHQIESFSKPVIALVNGYALGGGAELAMACHIRIATDNALVGLPEVSLGLIPGYGGTQRLPNLVGKSKAMEMILTGQPVKADEAHKIGLVNHVAPAADAYSYSVKLAEKMLKNGPIALEKAIEALNSVYSGNRFAKEATLFGQLCDTNDFREGTTAFLEKRNADFKGN